MKTRKSLSESKQSALQQTWLWLAAAIVLGSVVLLALALGYLREQTLQAAEKLNTALVGVVAEQTTRTLQAVDQRLELTAASLVQMREQGERNPASVAGVLQAQLKRLPFVRALWVLDAQGHIAFDSDNAHAADRTPLAAADRKPAQDYAQLFSTRPEIDITISQPQSSAQPGAWLIQIARPVHDRKGVLTGSVVAVLDLHHLDGIWSSIDLGTEGTIVLLRRDGSMLLRVPYTESAMGKNFGHLPVFRTLLPASDDGNYRARGAVDDVPRLFAYRALAAHPDLVVIVGRSESHVLARWRQWVSIVLWVWGTAVTLIVVLCAILVRAWRNTTRAQLSAQNSSKHYQNLFLEAPIAILATAPDGKIFAANPASCVLFGRSEQELQAMGERDLFDASDPRLKDSPIGCNRPGQLTGDFRFVRKSGEAFEGELFSSEFEDHEGQTRSTLIVRDTTEQHRYQNAQKESAFKLQALSRKIINAQEAERRRVANELHDELGQSLTAIKINLQSGARFKSRSPDQMNQENIRIVEDTLHQVRSLALALRPSILDNLGLDPALNWLGKQVAQRSGFEFDFLPLAGRQRLSPELETTCFRIVQEALTNIARHAKASLVTLSMQMEGDKLVIQLADNGIGLDWDAVRHAAESGNSAGVLGMLDRAALVGGSLTMDSAPGLGCTMTFKCPLQLRPENA